MKKLIAQVAESYRLAGFFILAAFPFFCMPVFFEGLQPIAEVKVGMFVGQGGDDITDIGKAADELTVEMCESIKAASIRLVTVACEVEDNDTIDMLKTCASAGSDFYDAKDAAKLKTAFGKIGSGFSSVRSTR